MMKKKLLIVAVVAVLAATATTAFFYNVLSHQVATTQPAKVTAVVVATRDLPRGALLQAEHLEILELPETQIPVGAVQGVESLLGRYLAVSVPAGRPLLDSYFPSRETGGIAAAIPPGMRAVSLHVEEYAGVTELVEAGDRVDVLMATERRAPGKPGINVHTILENLEVLDTGRWSQPTSQPQPTKPPVVTVLVQSKFAETLSLADQAGAVRLSLRNPTDQEAVITDAEPVRSRLSARARSSSRSRSRLPASKPVEPESVKKVEDVQSAEQGTAPRLSASSHVLLALRFAGLGDEALDRFTRKLDRRRQAAPMIVSTFEQNWDAAGSLELLRREEAVEVFAAPDLLTLSTAEARFEQRSVTPLAGGATEFEVDEVGVRVTLTPQLVGERIRIKIVSEVSTPDAAHSVQTDVGRMARVSRRRAECEIEVAQGQSFWIRGLIDRPGAWDFLRRLFPDRPLERDAHDELVILVTPTLAAPEANEPTTLSALVED